MATTPRPRYVVDDEGKPSGVLLDIDDYRQMPEELESIRAYDEAKASSDEVVPFEQAPVVTLFVGAGELLGLGLGDRARKPDRLALVLVGARLVGRVIGEQLAELRLDREAGRDRVEGGVGLHLGGVEVQFLAPDQAGLAALLDDRLEEAPEDGQAVPLRIRVRLE
jgi:hypothetical protein